MAFHCTFSGVLVRNTNIGLVTQFTTLGFHCSLNGILGETNIGM